MQTTDVVDEKKRAQRFLTPLRPLWLFKSVILHQFMQLTLGDIGLVGLIIDGDECNVASSRDSVSPTASGRGRNQAWCQSYSSLSRSSALIPWS